VLNSLSTGFDKLQYGTMLVSTPRLTLDEPVHWLRGEQHPKLTGALSLDAGKTSFSSGSELPLHVKVQDRRTGSHLVSVQRGAPRQ
jgi:hypothetical protein